MAEPSGAAPFFDPNEPPPEFSQPPADDRLQQIIIKLAQFASRNGPSFVDVIRQKQAGNTDYNFLSGGEGAGYWRWYLYCTLYNLPPGVCMSVLKIRSDVTAMATDNASGNAISVGQPGRVLKSQFPARHLSQCRACCADQQLLPQYEAPMEPSAIDQLPAEVRDGFAQVLAALTGSKVRS